MKTQDIFKLTSAKINESISKTFGRKLNLESFDLDKLEDARNKLRTQISQARSGSEFNENLDNDAFHQAQWMLDAINVEIAEREEFAVAEGEEDKNGVRDDLINEIEMILDGALGGTNQTDHIIDELGDIFQDIESSGDKVAMAAYEMMNDVIDQDTRLQIRAARKALEMLKKGDETDNDAAVTPGFRPDEGVQNEAYINNAADAINILADIRKQSKMAERGQGDPVRPNQLVNDLYDVMQWIEANMKESIDKESITTGEDMSNVTEGEIQQASAIVTAKTMVDRVGRWIEELSGMENDTLLQLGDSIRDEMGQQQAKAFIEAVAPAIQQALENLKATRETLATGVRTLTGEEQGAEMLGAEPAADAEVAPAEPDAMNAAQPEDDEFAAADPAAGGLGDAGREQRESINRSSNLLRILAG